MIIDFFNFPSCGFGSLHLIFRAPPLQFSIFISYSSIIVTLLSIRTTKHTLQMFIRTRIDISSLTWIYKHTTLTHELPHTHTDMPTYIYIYIYTYAWICPLPRGNIYTHTHIPSTMEIYTYTPIHKGACMHAHLQIMTAFEKEEKAFLLKQNSGRKRKLSDRDRRTLTWIVRKDH